VSLDRHLKLGFKTKKNINFSGYYTDNNFKLDGKSSEELVVVCMSMLSAPVLAELYSFSYGGFGFSQTY
jgi:hypothetical protein